MKYIFLLFTIFCLSLNCHAASNQADTVIIKAYLDSLTKTELPRSIEHIEQLDAAAAFIKTVFKKYSDSVSTQEYLVFRRKYQNVICSFGPYNAKRIIIGAHYDVCGSQPGADDNATGVVGLLELARLLKGKTLKYRIDLVAYSLEEPPYFRTEYMGSYIHAKYLKDKKIKVYGMVSLEMLGYFRDKNKTQTYPLGIFSIFFGEKANFIALIKKMGAGSFARKFCRKFKTAHTIKTIKFSGPPAMPGIDWSDHLNYWKFGYSALMVTDTSFYRNPNYHQKSDAMETLDLKRMSKVIDGVYAAVIGM